MWAAFDLARIRPLDQMLGHPEGTDADEAPITAVKGVTIGKWAGKA